MILQNVDFFLVEVRRVELLSYRFTHQRLQA